MKCRNRLKSNKSIKKVSISPNKAKLRDRASFTFLQSDYASQRSRLRGPLPLVEDL